MQFEQWKKVRLIEDSACHREQGIDMGSDQITCFVAEQIGAGTVYIEQGTIVLKGQTPGGCGLNEAFQFSLLV